MTKQTSIRMLSQPEFSTGVCAVCEVPAVLKFEDAELGRVGDCCRAALVAADVALNTNSHYNRAFARPQR